MRATAPESKQKTKSSLRSSTLPLISLVIPVFNEDSLTIKNLDTGLMLLIQGMKNRVRFEILIVDDSTEGVARKIIRELVASNKVYRAIFFSRNFGKESALRAGLEHSQGDAVIPLDADLQDPLDLIPEMINYWESGYPVVLAKRIDRRLDSKQKRFWSTIFYKTMGKFADIKIPENVGDFRLMDKKVVSAVLSLNERNVFMRGIYAWSGFEYKVIEYARPDREHGKSKFPFKRLLKIGIDGLISFSSFPLRMWSMFGFFLAGLSFLFTMVIVYLKISQQVAIPEYTFLLVAVLFSTSTNLICFGIFGEYISRLFIESKQRPHYIIQEKIGFPTVD